MIVLFVIFVREWTYSNTMLIIIRYKLENFISLQVTQNLFFPRIIDNINLGVCDILEKHNLRLDYILE